MLKTLRLKKSSILLNQVFNAIISRFFFRFRYVYSIRADVRQGYFEEDEDHILLVGAKLFGHDWARISHFIPSRTPMQIHSRFNTFLKANFENWTQEEDLQLLEKVKEKGTKDWKQIANEFQSRTRSQCRQRFYYIHKVCQEYILCALSVNFGRIFLRWQHS